MNRILTTLLFLLLCMATANAQQQELALKRGDKTITGKPDASGQSWEFEMGGKTYLLIEREWVRRLAQKVRELENDADWVNKIVIAKDSLIAAYQSYEEKADEHIGTQKALIDTADSLYTGYKGLYNDLKTALNLKSTFAITFGGGFVNPPQTGWRAVISAGLGTNRWQGHFQLGDNYLGFLVNARLPLGF